MFVYSIGVGAFDVDLTGIVAVVTGASRGAGRGIAQVLGGAGATVYVTGRSTIGVPSGPGRALALAPGHLGVTETPEYIGRAVATLAADPDLMVKTGSLLTVGELAREYAFTDIDGTRPEPFGLPLPG